MSKAKVGDVIKLKNSHEECGYKKGDIIHIKREASANPKHLVGDNLQNPDAYGRGYVYIGDYAIYKIIKRANQDGKVKECLYEIKLFGLTLFKIYRVK